MDIHTKFAAAFLKYSLPAFSYGEATTVDHSVNSAYINVSLPALLEKSWLFSASLAPASLLFYLN